MHNTIMNVALLDHQRRPDACNSNSVIHCIVMLMSMVYMNILIGYSIMSGSEEKGNSWSLRSYVHCSKSKVSSEPHLGTISFNSDYIFCDL